MRGIRGWGPGGYGFPDVMGWAKKRIPSGSGMEPKRIPLGAGKDPLGSQSRSEVDLVGFEGWSGDIMESQGMVRHSKAFVRKMSNNISGNYGLYAMQVMALKKYRSTYGVH